MTLMELIEDGLKRHGYDGLFNTGVCACKLADLAPCDNDMSGCEPGVFTDGPCSACEGETSCDFHIGQHGSPNNQDDILDDLVATEDYLNDNGD